MNKSSQNLLLIISGKNELKFEDTWENIYKFIHKLFDNRFKQFRFKLLHRIIPSKVNLYIWKISTSNLCNVCLVKESYQHQFIDCKTIEDFWSKLIAIFKKCGISTNIKNLKNIVIGYKTNTENYNDINIIFTIVGFSIFKSYYASECRSKPIDTFNIFKYEFNNSYNFLLNHHDFPITFLKLFWIFLNNP